MKSKGIAIIIVFTAITLSLHPTLSGLAVPSFSPGRYFQFWEIPIFIALLLLGLKYAVTIAVLDNVAVMVIFSGGGVTSWFNIIPLLSTLLGVYFVHRIFSRRDSKKEVPSKLKETIFAVPSGYLFRLLIGGPAYYFMLRYLMLMPDPVIFTKIILNSIHDAILVSYSVPTSYLMAGIIRKKLGIGKKTTSRPSNQFLKD
jgi:riboflavin transporter FmnP